MSVAGSFKASSFNTPGMRRVARSYGPLLFAALLFVVVGSIVEPVPRGFERIGGDELSIGVPAGGVPSQATDPNGAVIPGSGGPATPGATTPGAPGTNGGIGGNNPGNPGNPSQPKGPTGAVTACTDRAKQVSGDPYSPPCVVFNGDNGGATSKGVTGTDITVAVRVLDGPTAAQLFAQISGQNVIDSPEAYKDTTIALAEYFSSRFNFYGRKIKLVFYKGQGNGSSELLGGGKETALADSVTVAKQIGAFADISGITIPYADALSKAGVVNFGAPYPSGKWFADRKPYAWSLFPDGTNVVNSGSAWIINRLGPGTNADFAGPALKGKPRKYAVVAPENEEYQGSVGLYQDQLAKAGIKIDLRIKYKLDVSSMPNQASNIVAQLKDAGITSVICGCDPVMLALGLTPKANEQDYQPEWLTSGLAFVDQDIVSQLIDGKQWQRAFGIAYNAESEPIGHSYPYAAYKKMRPNDEPAFGVEELYYSMYMLAIGLQMAGPNLTPQSFAAGMFAYPGGSGPRGSWKFGPSDFTPTDDFREIWWDPNRISGQNNRAGAWVQLNGGKRYFPSTVPKGPANYFKEG